jgi:hypothetical protein
MNRLNARISRLEKKFGIRRVKIAPPVIVLRFSRYGEISLPEPVEEWITYKQAIESHRYSDDLMMFEADPEKELAARELAKSNKNLQNGAECQTS